MLEFEEIKSYELMKYLYEDYAKYEQVMKEATFTNQEIKKISLEKVTPELKERAQELQVKATREIEKLGEIICNFHKDFKMLREACQD